MQAIELVRWALQMTDEALQRIVEDLREHPLTQPGPDGGNHAIWILGHLCCIEGSLRNILTGEPNPVADWEPLFGTGSTPQTDAAAYPSFDELLRTFHALRADTLRRLDAVGNEGLDRAPSNVPPGFEEACKTYGRTFC